MTDTAPATSIASRPGRRTVHVRPKWIIAALVLCLGAFFAWRLTHLGDPRFVGRWSVQGHGYGDASMELELTRFGTGRRDLSPVVEELPVVEFGWRAEQERMIFYWPPPDGPLRERIQLFVANAWRRWQGEPELGTDVYVFEPTGANCYRFRSETSQDSGFEILRVEE
jgi:hypothetical protein